MKNFHSVAKMLDLTIDEILEVLDLTFQDAEEEDLSVEEILDSLVDNGLDIWDYNDWQGDSCCNYIDA